jgi:hypothetical protein
MVDPLNLLAIVFAALGCGTGIATVVAFRRRRAVRATTTTLLALLMLSLTALFATLSGSTQGYRALTHEELAASVTTRSLSEQLFEARVRFPDGADSVFTLAGDEFLVDARILKWKPIANVLGLHTEYQLDRISGRYQDLRDEQILPRTVFALSQRADLDLFDLRRKHPVLGWLVDAEYGSGTFVAPEDGARFDVLVSTTGLLVRRRSSPMNE